MAATTLLINPGPRRRKAAKRKANPAHARKHPRVAKRKRNPSLLSHARRVVRKVRAHRRRNPGRALAMGKSFVPMLKAALIGGAGAFGVDYLWAQIAPKLPASMNSGNTGAAVKAVATIVLGRALSKPTKGISEQLAAGALTVQAYGLIHSYMPGAAPATSAPAAAAQTAAGLGFASPLPVVTAPSLRYNPTGVQPGNMAAFTRGRVPGLGAFTQGSVPSVMGSGRLFRSRMGG